MTEAHPRWRGWHIDQLPGKSDPAGDGRLSQIAARLTGNRTVPYQLQAVATPTASVRPRLPVSFSKTDQLVNRFADIRRWPESHSQAPDRSAPAPASTHLKAHTRITAAGKQPLEKGASHPPAATCHQPGPADPPADQLRGAESSHPAIAFCQRWQDETRYIGH
jgi:hypothetical protein